MIQPAEGLGTVVDGFQPIRFRGQVALVDSGE